MLLSLSPEFLKPYCHDSWFTGAWNNWCLGSLRTCSGRWGCLLGKGTGVRIRESSPPQTTWIAPKRGEKEEEKCKKVRPLRILVLRKKRKTDSWLLPGRTTMTGKLA